MIIAYLMATNCLGPRAMNINNTRVNDKEVRDYVRRNKANKQVTITGIVTPCDWDANGNVIAVAISATDEQEYVVDDDQQGQELRKLVYEQVRVTGCIRKDAKGNEFITIEQFQVLDHKDEDEY